MTAAEDAIRGLARALGVWEGGKATTRGWGVRVVDDRFAVFRPGETGGVLVDDAETLLVLSLLALPPERGACPDCAGRMVQERRVHTADDRRHEVWGEGWLRTGPRQRENIGALGERWVSYWTRPCLTCKGPASVCRGCGGSRRQRYVRQRPGDAPRWSDPPGPSPHRPSAVDLDIGERECPQCLATGMVPGEPRGYIDVHRWADRFLGAMPEWGTVAPGAEVTVFGNDRKPRPAREGESVIVEAGNAEDIDALTVFADELQAAGDPLGEWLALCLTRAPCEMKCEPDPSGIRVVRHGRMRGECCTCHGTGLALGACLPAMIAHANRLAEGLRGG